MPITKSELDALFEVIEKKIAQMIAAHEARLHGVKGGTGDNLDASAFRSALEQGLGVSKGETSPKRGPVYLDTKGGAA